jgi:hypothetical protein
MIDEAWKFLKYKVCQDHDFKKIEKSKEIWNSNEKINAQFECRKCGSIMFVDDEDWFYVYPPGQLTCRQRAMRKALK